MRELESHQVDYRVYFAVNKQSSNQLPGKRYTFPILEKTNCNDILSTRQHLLDISCQFVIKITVKSSHAAFNGSIATDLEQVI